MTPRQITSNTTNVACDVCGRTLLRGEEADVFLAGGSRRNVCELCAPRAAAEGWIREALADDGLAVRERRDRGRGSLFGRLRARGEAAREGLRSRRPPAPDGHHEAAAGLEVDHDGWVLDGVDVPREPRQVHAIPTNADMKRLRAVDLFNSSEHPHTVAALSRTLGAPFATVRPSDTEGSIVIVTVAWELCWYRYEVDLADEAAGVRQTAQGGELSELDPADQEPNAAADERGELELVAG